MVIVISKKLRIAIVAVLLTSIPLYFLILKPYNETLRLKKNYFTISQSGEINLVSNKPKQWLSLGSVSKDALTAIVISEDWAFYSHIGVDFRQIYHSIKDALNGKNLRGASTISQQVIKNIFFSSKRSFSRKFYELFYTLFLEFNLSKSKILELYINLVELGPEVYGVNNASRYYFNVNPMLLTARHGAFLATMLPSPVKYNESFRNKELTSFVSGNMNRILDKMVMAKYLTRDEANFQKNKAFLWEQKTIEHLEYDEEFFEYNQ